MTSLTRHLYRSDEVRASCRYCLLRRLHTQAVFWAMELIDSSLILELLEEVTYAYFYSVRNTEVLRGILDLTKQEEISADEVLSFVHAICLCQERDSTLIALLNAGGGKQRDTVVPGGLPSEYSAADEVTQCFVRALHQGKKELAWGLLVRVPALWDIVDRYSDGFTVTLRTAFNDAFHWESRGTCLLYVMDLLSPKKVRASKVLKMSSGVQEQMEAWTALEGRRARRAFAIRPEAILLTARGLLSNLTTNLAEVREPLQGLQGSPYWETVAEELGGWDAIQRKSAVKEAFYDLYFPDDIPDEWSLEDQKKSHGHGLLTADGSEELQRLKLYRAGFRENLVYGITAESIRPLEYGSLYENLSLEGWILRPMRKKIVPIN